jgi:hypothetical protein
MQIKPSPSNKSSSSRLSRYEIVMLVIAILGLVLALLGLILTTVQALAALIDLLHWAGWL